MTNLLALAFFLILTPFYLNDVQAKESFQPETVKTRSRPQYDPVGIRAASFNIFPKLSVTEYFDDNIFADSVNEKSDFITDIQPQLIIKSNWNNHALTLSSSANIHQHLNNEAENSEDFNFIGHGRIDILRQSRLEGGASYEQNHQRRSSPDDVQGLVPTIFHETTVFSFIEHELNLFTLKTGIRYVNLDFDDVASSIGVINNDDRDRDRVTGDFRISYSISPQYSMFVDGFINRLNYENLSDGLALNRDSKGYGINLGSIFHGSRLFFGELFIGFKEQAYRDPRLKTIYGVTGGGSITWQPSILTTFNLSSSRSIRETTVGIASGIFQTEAKFEIDHELLRNLLLNFNLSVSQEDFRGIDREDKYLNIGVGSNYLMDPLVNFGLKYDFTTRHSNRDASNFTRNAVYFNLNLQL